MERSLYRLCTISAVTVCATLSQAYGEGTENLEPVVITASRIATPQSRVAQSITVIEPTESDRTSGRLVYELLREVPGLNVINTGGPGQSTTIQVRGANSEQTLVLLDGVPLNDPTNPGRGYDFAQLSAHEIERIEVLRGAQSGVHGNNSTGGVIQIITRKAGAHVRAGVRGDYGAFNTRRLSGSAGGSFGQTRVTASALYEKSDGFPAANAAYGNTLNNGYRRWTGTFVLDRNLARALEASMTARVTQTQTSLPLNGGPPAVGTGQDPNYTGEDAQGILATKLRYTGSSFWEPSISVGLNLVARRYDNLPDSVNTDVLQESVRGRRLKIEQSNQLALSEASTFALGLDTQIETIYVSQDYGFGASVIDGKSQAISGIFSEYRWENEQAFFTAAARADRFHGNSDQFTYRFGPGVRVLTPNTLLKTSLGRGFKIPSLYQIYSTFGDPNLRSERSLSWDLSVEHSIREPGSSTKFGATYFNSAFQDLINFNQAFEYENIQSASIRGGEFSVSHERASGIGFGLNYIYQIARNDKTLEGLPRRPEELLTARLSAGGGTALQYGLSMRLTGTRADVNPAPPYNPVRMPSYTVFHADASYTIGGGYKAFGRLDNMLDREYEEVAGYGTARRSLYVGLQKEI